MRRALTTLAVLLLVLASVAPAVTAAPTLTAPEAVDTVAADAAETAPADPAEDRIGWENGYWHNESINVDQSDGLSDAELKRYVARAMARVEYVRGAEFNETVPVSVISREAYRNRTSGGSTDRSAFNNWNDQVWEGLFIIGESTGSGEELGETRGSSVAGFYSPSDDEIKIITPNPDEPVINNATLVHELVHALQDQQHDLTSPRYRAQTQDGSLAVNGVVEGEANYIEARYSERCGGMWRCVRTPESGGGGGGGGGGGPNLGVLLTLLNPYSDGPVYIHHLVETGGWERVEQRHRNLPLSSEQIIHRTNETPRPLSFTDRATGEWSTFPRDDPRFGQNGSDTVGEASIYAMFWYQAREYGADTIDPRTLFRTSSPYDTYNYDARPSNGWANDRLFPYRTGTGDDAEFGYVWMTAWDTRKDAKQFHAAYLRMLEAHDVRRTDEGYYVVPDGEFADAFAVQRDGKRVTIVNGPTVADVKQIRPGIDAATPTSTPVPTTETTSEPGPITDTPETETPTSTDSPGFSVITALVALLAGALLARRR